MIDSFLKLKWNLQFDWFFNETLFREEFSLVIKYLTENQKRVNLYFLKMITTRITTKIFKGVFK